jgi:hypothetical protein
VNLKQGLGIVDWQSLDAQVTDPSVIFCVGEELADCWYAEEDAHWLLLSNMVQALGQEISNLEPVEPEDLPPDAVAVWAFDGHHLPLLSEMLADPSQKVRTWQKLCSSQELVSSS